MNSGPTKLVDPTSTSEANPVSNLWIQAGILLVLIAFIYRNILHSLVLDWWTDPNFSHGFLIPLFSGFVAWQKRKKLAALQLQPSWLGLVIIAGSMGILIVGFFGVEQFLQRSSLVLLLAGLIIYFWGWRHFRELIFPWAFLFFMIPIPTIIFNQIAFPLQFLAARLASNLLVLFGVPVLREGNVIQLPGRALEVAEACSGIRSLMSLGALAVIYGYFLDNNNFRRIILAAASIPIAVAANGLRVMGTGLAGYYWDPDKAEGFFHTFSGWVIFVLSLFMLFAFHGLMTWTGKWISRRKRVAT